MSNCESGGPGWCRGGEGAALQFDLGLIKCEMPAGGLNAETQQAVRLGSGTEGSKYEGGRSSGWNHSEEENAAEKAVTIDPKVVPPPQSSVEKLGISKAD